MTLSDGDLDALLARLVAEPVAVSADLPAESVRELAAGLAAARAAHALARPQGARVALLGVRGRGRWALRALSRLRSLHQVTLHDARPFVAGRFAAALAREIPAKVVPVDAHDEALLDADIVLLDAPTTLYPELLAEGAHVGVLRPDALPLDLLDAGLLVLEDDGMRVDSLAQAVTLAEVLAGAVSVRASPLTVYLAGSGRWPAARLASYFGSE